MLVRAKNNKEVFLRRLGTGDFGSLCDYLQQLGPDTVRRFGPHKFDRQSINDLFTGSDNHIGYIAVDAETSVIIAYSIIKLGYLEHDRSRLISFGIIPNHKTDCTYAPSVADAWQSLGVGNSLLGFILSELKATWIKRIILWGGVQCDNHRAVNFYLKNGFRILGQFEYNGQNYDMISEFGKGI